MKKRRIYVASSWRNQRQPEVVEALRKRGHEVYDFRNPTEGDKGFQWSEIDQDWKTWDMNTYREALDHPIAVSGFRNDWNAMEWADTGILVMPCGRSAHLEAGYFVGAKKDLVILLSDGEPELMYKMASAVCLNMDEVLDFLGQHNYEI